LTNEKTKLIKENRIRFLLTHKKKSRKYIYLNTRFELRIHDAGKSILDVPLSSDGMNNFIAEFEEQKERGTIPEEVANIFGSRFQCWITYSLLCI